MTAHNSTTCPWCPAEAAASCDFRQPPSDDEGRVKAAAVAVGLLTVKAGKYADRPLNVSDVIALAEWLLGEPVLTEDEREAIAHHLKVVQP